MVIPHTIIGLCSYAIVLRCIVQNIIGDVDRIQTYHVRFVGHVFPGEHYLIEVWNEPTHMWIRATVVERNKECLVGYLTTRPLSKL